jgi:hypothetical protein
MFREEKGILPAPIIITGKIREIAKINEAASEKRNKMSMLRGFF